MERVQRVKLAGPDGEFQLRINHEKPSRAELRPFVGLPTVDNERGRGSSEDEGKNAESDQD